MEVYIPILCDWLPYEIAWCIETDVNARMLQEAFLVGKQPVTKSKSLNVINQTKNLMPGKWKTYVETRLQHAGGSIPNLKDEMFSSDFDPVDGSFQVNKSTLHVQQCLNFKKYWVQQPATFTVPSHLFLGQMFSQGGTVLYITPYPLRENKLLLWNLFSVLHEISDRLLSFGNRITMHVDNFTSAERTDVDVMAYRHTYLFEYVHVIGTECNYAFLTSNNDAMARHTNKGTVKQFQNCVLENQGPIALHCILYSHRTLNGTADFYPRGRRLYYLFENEGRA